MAKKDNSDIKKNTTALYQHVNPRWPPARMPYYGNHYISCSDSGMIFIYLSIHRFLRSGNPYVYFIFQRNHQDILKSKMAAKAGPQCQGFSHLGCSILQMSRFSQWIHVLQTILFQKSIRATLKFASNPRWPPKFKNTRQITKNVISQSSLCPFMVVFN